MMKLVYVAVIFLALNASCKEGKALVVYRPHYLSGNAEIEYFGDSKLSKEQLINTIKVFDYYGVEYVVCSDSILITEKLDQDWELVWNLTSKSEDSSWLRIHKR